LLSENKPLRGKIERIFFVINLGPRSFSAADMLFFISSLYNSLSASILELLFLLLNVGLNGIDGQLVDVSPLLDCKVAARPNLLFMRFLSQISLRHNHQKLSYAGM
jgi:hypothetical protein